MTGTPQNRHLEKIEDDQSIQGISRIEDTIRNDAGRKYFVSQSIQPVLSQGYYDPATGRYVLGQPLPTTATTVSAALNTPSVTLTCPVNHVYKVIHVNGSNNTTASLWTLTYTPNGGTAIALHRSIGAATAAAAAIAPLMGYSAATQATTACPSQFAGPLYMRSGDTLNVENTNDVAGDTITISFIYEDYTLEA